MMFSACLSVQRFTRINILYRPYFLILCLKKGCFLNNMIYASVQDQKKLFQAFIVYVPLYFVKPAGTILPSRSKADDF